MHRTSRWFAVLIVGCAPAAKPPSAHVQPAAPAPPPVITDRLEAGATYLDLVRSAVALADQQRQPDCLLAREGEGFRLRAELASSVRPLPLPTDELDATLKQADRVELLSAWGRHGDGSAPLALVGFTHAAPAREAVALLATDRGLSVRGASGTGLTPRDELDPAQAAAALAQLPDALVFVTAEARYPLSQLANVLSTLRDAQREVVLATNLGPGTALPKQASVGRPARCPEGLPPTDQPDGELSRDQLIAAIAPLKEMAAECLTRGDARGAAGGRLTVGMRVNASGQVEQACLVQDELGDDPVASCVTELARRLSFPPPAPAGVLDIELPVALRPGSRVVQPALCTP